LLVPLQAPRWLPPPFPALQATAQQAQRAQQAQPQPGVPAPMQQSIQFNSIQYCAVPVVHVVLQPVTGAQHTKEARLQPEFQPYHSLASSSW
jgi:hypothetical protein